MRLIQRSPQETRADALALVRRLDLDLTYLQRASALEQLNHAHALAIDLYGVDAAAIPALSTVSLMACLVPPTPGRDEQLLVDGPAQSFEPGQVVCGSWN